MGRRPVFRSIAGIALAVVMLGLGVTASNTATAAQPTADPHSQGVVSITFNDAFVQQMFKAGVFMYGSSEVGVYLSDSGSLTAQFPMTGQSSNRPTTALSVDGEVGGLSLYNGPAEATAGILGITIRRTGTTGVVNARVIGPYSAESGQFSQAMTVFTLSAARAKRTSSGWTMRGTLTLTAQGASTLNTLLKTTVFTTGGPVGSMDAAVVSR